MFRKYLLMHFPILIIWIISLPEVGTRQVVNAAMTNLSSGHRNDTAKDKVEPEHSLGDFNSGISEGHRTAGGSTPAVMRGKQSQQGV